MRPTSSRSSPAGSSTRTLRCGLRPRCSHAIPGGPRRSGGTEFPAISRSSWCGSTNPRIRSIVRQLLRAHEYWRMKQLAVDLVILNEQAPSYAQDLQASLEAQVRTSQSRSRHEGHEPHGSVFILRADLVSAEDRILLQTAARAVLLSRRGTLAEQVVRRPRSQAAAVPLPRRRPATQPLDVVRRRGPTSSSSTASVASLRMAVSM